MLTDYYIRPTTVDRIQASWIASAIEQYVHWLKEHDYRTRSILHRVPVLTRFGEFAKGRGACEFAHLPDHVEPFVHEWVRERARGRSTARRKRVSQEVRNPIQQMLRLMVPGYTGLGRPHKPTTLSSGKLRSSWSFWPKRRVAPAHDPAIPLSLAPVRHLSGAYQH